MPIRLRPLARPRGLAFAAALAFLAFATGVVAGRSTIEVEINGKPFVTSPAWRIEEGRVIGPIVPVAQALDARVLRSRDGLGLALESPNPWLFIDHEHWWGLSRPCDFDALGPIMAVRHLLSERQWQSMDAAASPRVLARFEIVDAFYTEMPGGMPWPGGKVAPVVVTAVLYWVTLDPTRAVPRTALRQIHAENAARQESYILDGPRPVTADIDRVEFTLDPDGVSFGNPADLAIPTAVKAESVTLGTKGWTVAQEKVVSSRRVEVPNHNDVVPLYDPAFQKLPKGALLWAAAGRPRVLSGPGGTGPF